MSTQKLITYIGVGLLGGLLILGAQFFHSDSIWFPINTIKVEGQFRFVRKQYVESVVTPYLRQGFWGINLAHIGKELRDSGWIKKAHLERVWPDTILVKITEHEPELRLGDNTLVDKDGSLFTPSPVSIPDSIPLVRSDTGLTKDLLQQFKKISNILGRAQLKVVQFDKGRTTLTLNTSKGLQLVASQKSFASELQRFVDVYPTIAKEKKTQIARIDLRYRHGMAVQWK